MQMSWKLEDCMKFTESRSEESSTVFDGTKAEASFPSLNAFVSQVSASQTEYSSTSISCLDDKNDEVSIKNKGSDNPRNLERNDSHSFLQSK